MVAPSRSCCTDTFHRVGHVFHYSLGKVYMWLCHEVWCTGSVNIACAIYHPAFQFANCIKTAASELIKIHQWSQNICASCCSSMKLSNIKIYCLINCRAWINEVSRKISLKRHCTIPTWKGYNVHADLTSDRLCPDLRSSIGPKSCQSETQILVASLILNDRTVLLCRVSVSPSFNNTAGL